MFRKYLMVLIGCLITTVSIAAERLDDKSAIFVYEAHADIKTPEDELAKLISTDYRKARDEFTKHDLMQNIRPVLKKRITEAKAQKTVKLLISSKLGEYDFNGHTFPTGFSATSYIPYDNKYAAKFINAETLTDLEIEFSKAKTLSSKLQSTRRVTLEVIAEVVGAKEEDLKPWFTNKTVQLKAKHLKVSFEDNDQLIGEKSL